MNQLEFENKDLKACWRMSLVEEVSSLISRTDGVESNSSMNNILTEGMTINLNVFGAIMENIIVSNLNNTLMVTMNRSRTKERDTHISKKPAESKKFLSSIGQCTIFSFGTRASSNRLFLAAP